MTARHTVARLMVPDLLLTGGCGIANVEDRRGRDIAVLSPVPAQIRAWEVYLCVVSAVCIGLAEDSVFRYKARCDKDVRPISKFRL